MRQVKIKSRTGVFTVEYLLIFAVIFIALLAIYSLFQQTISGKYRDAADTFGSGRQFEPYGAHKTIIE